MDKPQHGSSKDSRLSSASSESSANDGFYDFDEEVRTRNMEMLMMPQDSSNSLRYSTDSCHTNEFASFKKEDELWVLESASMKMQSAEAVAEYYKRNPGVPRIQASSSTVQTVDPKSRIPSHVFAKDPSSNPANWSVTSNESLFSIKNGNMSFSKDQAVLNHPENIVMSGKTQETEKAVLSENETDHISNKNSPDGEKVPSPPPLESSSSSKSSKKSEKSESLKESKPEEKPEEPKEAPLGGFSWLSCFPCCKGLPDTENPALEEAGKKPEAGVVDDKKSDDKKPEDDVEGSKGKAGKT